MSLPERREILLHPRDAWAAPRGPKVQQDMLPFGDQRAKFLTFPLVAFKGGTSLGLGLLWRIGAV